MVKKKYIWPALGIIFILIQFIRIDKTNPSIDPTLDFIKTINAPAEIASKIQISCYDCHSHETSYPWYTNIAPLSWWIKGHINGGREHLNFSEWNKYSKDKQKHKLEEGVEMLEKKWMPLFTYTWLHSEAKMTDVERESMISFFEGLKNSK
jgi:hypothetical protein